VQNSILQWLSSKMLERQLQPRELLTARKLVYVALIVVLFTASFFWRRASVDARAQELAIRQDSRGDVELSGELVRLSLTGSRGIATCVLWVQAIEKQKKNQWNELEFLVRSLTKLQPHFITPWLFQSWNLAYNVSVESDRVNDKYFYITRGIDLLAEGERQNRYHPDMRFSIGFYTQHKIMVSDQTNVLRSLLQLSMIPPSERDPDRFEKRRDDGGKEIDWVEFEKFVTKYPQLARRLHSGMLRDSKTENQSQFTCRDADEVILARARDLRAPREAARRPCGAEGRAAAAGGALPAAAAAAIGRAATGAILPHTGLQRAELGLEPRRYDRRLLRGAGVVRLRARAAAQAGRPSRRQ